VLLKIKKSYPDTAAFWCHVSNESGSWSLGRPKEQGSVKLLDFQKNRIL
jgi:hypothetical protein